MRQDKKPFIHAFERTQPIHNDFLDIPLIGQVRPGNPGTEGGDYELNELIHNYHHIRQRIITVEILDNAMSHTGIFKGDFLTVDLDTHPENGDLAVVKLGERIFVRKFFKHNSRVRLETASEYPSSLIIESNTPNFAVLGKVQSLTRHL